MASVLKTTKISCTSSEAKSKVLAVLREASDHVIVNKPGTIQYLVALPVEGVNANEIYVIEEFETIAAFESRQFVQPVRALEALVSDTGICSKRPEIHIGSVAIKATSGRPLSLSSKPAILLIRMDYKPGTLSNAVEGWKDMAKGAINSVPGVDLFTVMEDTEMSCVRTVEVLDTWDCLSVLVNTDAAKRNIGHNGKDRTGFKSAIKLHAIAGFFGRS